MKVHRKTSRILHMSGKAYCYLECGRVLFTHLRLRATSRWCDTTCKNCLATRPKRKGKR